MGVNARIREILILMSRPSQTRRQQGQRISGTVTDTSGAVVPSTAVSIVSQDTRLESKTSTDNSGCYLIVNLPVGNLQCHCRGHGSP